MKTAPESPVSIPSLLQILGISQVIWIDDSFAPLTAEETKRNLLRDAAIVHDTGGRFEDNELIFLNDLGDDDEIEPRLEALLTEKPDLLEKLSLALQQQASTIEAADKYPGESEHTKDLSKLEIDALKKGFGNIAEYLSLREWNERSDALLKASEPSRILYLIDREFKRENAPQAGDEILQTVLARTQAKAPCIMFTYTAVIGMEESTRDQIITQLQEPCKKYHLSVISKQRVENADKDVSGRFALALRQLFIHRSCASMTDQMANLMLGAIPNIVEKLLDLSIDWIDASIFSSSLDEGASETDVTSRILFIGQRMAVEEALPQQGPLFKELQTLRQLRQKTAKLINSAPQPEHPSLQALHAWRRNEVVEPGHYINSLYLTLTSGDIFEGPENTRYVLLGQPCDIALRPDGKRLAQEAIFVQVTEAEPAASELRERFFVIKNMTPQGLPWSFDFRKIGFVNLQVLDFASFRSDGRVALSAEQKPAETFLPGSRKRLERLAKLLPADQSTPLPIELQVLSFSKTTAAITGRWNDHGEWQFPLRRVERLRPAYATSVLAAFATFQTRAAFEHDFTRQTSSPEPAPAVRPATAT